MGIFAALAEILFVGHSLVGPNLPGLVEAALATGGTPSRVEAQVINGAPLVWSWDHSAEGEGVDARARLAEGTVTDLILTEAQPVADHVQWNDTAGQVARWAGAAREANPDTRVWLYETWPAFGAGGAAEWRAKIATDLPLWEGAAGDQARIIPAGQAMAALSLALEAGEVPGLTSIAEFFDDEIHPSDKGLYFVAMVQVAALTGASPEALPAKVTRLWPSRAAVMSEDQADALQRIAWVAVSGYAQPAPSQTSPGAATPAAADGDTAMPDPATATAVGPEPAAGGVADAADGVATEPAAAEVPQTSPGAEGAVALTAITNPNLALGLAGVHDWSVQQPFLDVMKTARPWVAHLPGQWGGWEEADLRAAGALDAEGWPTRIPEEVTGIATLILTDLPAEAGGVAGRYVLTHQGNGELTVSGRGIVVEQAPGRIVFDYTPGEGGVILTLTETDPADPLRAITVVREDRAAALAAGEVFNPDWLARIRGAKMLRFMDWLATNDSTLALAADRPKPADYSWARTGVPVEIIARLANELDADPWVNIPHLAEDALVREMATVLLRDLEPGRQVWVEYSNEVWNWQFTQAAWAEEQAKARWGREHAWVQFYALRAVEVMAIWSGVAQDPARLVRVIATQTGWTGLEADILASPLVTGEGKPAPEESFDAYAITGYVSGQLGTAEKEAAVRGWLADSRAAAESVAAELAEEDRAAHIEAHRFDLAIDRAAQELRDGRLTGARIDSLVQVTGEVFPYHAGVAQRYGLRLAMYEGGTHVVGQGALVDDPELTAFFTLLNYSPQMGQIYADLLKGWAAVSDAPFNAFVDVYAPGKWGSWGALRDLTDDNPRWQALATGCAAC